MTCTVCGSSQVGDEHPYDTCKCGHMRYSHASHRGACYDPDAECACKSYLTPQNARRAS